MKNLIFLTFSFFIFSVLVAEESPPTKVKETFNRGVALYKLGDYQAAFKAFQYAAEQGDSSAQCFLGMMYHDGQGVPQDYKQAVKWYTKAAEQGDASAQYFLGFMYYKGHGVPQDYKQAVKWSKKAAEQGHSIAQSSLSSFYFMGTGVLKDYAMAYAWANIAAANGGVSKKRDALTELLTPTQIAEGQKLSREMVAKNRKLLGK
jgi:TPR repeat protein